jgi:hypothetical protein
MMKPVAHLDMRCCRPRPLPGPSLSQTFHLREADCWSCLLALSATSPTALLSLATTGLLCKAVGQTLATHALTASACLLVPSELQSWNSNCHLALLAGGWLPSAMAVQWTRQMRSHCWIFLHAAVMREHLGSAEPGGPSAGFVTNLGLSSCHCQSAAVWAELCMAQCGRCSSA